MMDDVAKRNNCMGDGCGYLTEPVRHGIEKEFDR